MRRVVVAMCLCALLLAACCTAFAGDGGTPRDITTPDRGTSGGAGVTCVPAVPEPGAIVALAGGLTGIGFAAWRKRRG